MFGGAATQPCVQQQPHRLSSSAAQSQRKIRVIGHGTMDHRKRTMDRTTAGPPLNKGANDAATAATSPNQRVGWPGDAKSRQQLQVGGGAPRLPPRPSRLDRLVVDSWREHARVSALLERMARAQGAPLHPGIRGTAQGWLEAVL